MKKQVYLTPQNHPFIVCFGLCVGFVQSKKNREYHQPNLLGKYPPEPCPVSAGDRL